MAVTEFLTLKEVAKLFRVCDHTVREWERDRNFPVGVFSPRVRRYEREAVLKWARRAGLSTSEPVNA